MTANDTAGIVYTECCPSALPSRLGYSLVVKRISPPTGQSATSCWTWQVVHASVLQAAAIEHVPEQQTLKLCANSTSDPVYPLILINDPSKCKSREICTGFPARMNVSPLAHDFRTRTTESSLGGIGEPSQSAEHWSPTRAEKPAPAPETQNPNPPPPPKKTRKPQKKRVSYRSRDLLAQPGRRGPPKRECRAGRGGSRCPAL